MKLWHLACATVALGFACSTGESKPIPEGNVEGSGTLELALTGTDSRGNQYRLRNGEFFIEGYPDYYESAAGGASGDYYYETISSEDNPNAATIRKRVIPGYYYVHFTSGDWYFEKLTPSGAERIDKSVLLSSRTQYGRVWDGGVTNFAYRFGVGGDIIDFRAGDINIRIDIERPDDNNVGGGGAGGAPDDVVVAGAGGAAW